MLKAGDKVKVLPMPVLKETIHGKTGKLTRVKEYQSSLGSYLMGEAEIDGIGFVVFPIECFEQVTDD